MTPSSVCVLSLNCEGHKHLDKISRLLERTQPDVVCLQEIFAVDLPFLEKCFGQKFVFIPLVDVNTPNRYGIDQLGAWGVAIATNLPVVSTHTRHYLGDTATAVPQFRDGEPNSVNRAVVGVTVQHPQTQQHFTILTTHFTWSPNGHINLEQQRDLEQLFAVLNDFPEYLICGDFNAPRGREIYQQIVQKYRLRDNIPAEVTTTLDPELFRIKDINLVVDYLFTTPRYQIKNPQVITGVSDHCGVMGELSFA